MYLFLLEFTYAAKDCESIEAWLSQAQLSDMLISTMQYDDEILGVLASEQQLTEASLKILQQPTISLCQTKREAVYCVTTAVVPELVLRSFPFREGEEWYQGTKQTAYLCLQSHQLSARQIAWLATCKQIITWDFFCALSPVPLRGKVDYYV